MDPTPAAASPSDLHDVLLLRRDHLVLFPDVTVRQLLILILPAADVVLGNLPVFLHLLAFLIGFPADVVDGHFRLLAALLHHFELRGPARGGRRPRKSPRFSPSS